MSQRKLQGIVVAIVAGLAVLFVMGIGYLSELGNANGQALAQRAEQERTPAEQADDRPDVTSDRTVEIPQAADTDATQQDADRSSTIARRLFGTEESSLLQPGADDMRLSIRSPEDGIVIQGADVTLDVAVSGFELSPELIGKGTQAGKGHYHVYLDEQLIDFFATPQATISMRNVERGDHTFTVVPSQNNHTEIVRNAVTIGFRYEPTSPMATIPAADFPSRATVKILNPAPDQLVGDGFDLAIQTTGHNLSCELMGKDPIAGYGHWHLSLATDHDTASHGSLVAMGCEQVVHVSTAGLQPGSIHTLVVQLTDNAHAPIPGATDQIQIRVEG